LPPICLVNLVHFLLTLDLFWTAHLEIILSPVIPSSITTKQLRPPLPDFRQSISQWPYSRRLFASSGLSVMVLPPTLRWAFRTRLYDLFGLRPWRGKSLLVRLAKTPWSM